ncbi:MAG: GDSL-type esterase/lipase family protein [Armatimonadota bacterium]
MQLKIVDKLKTAAPVRLVGFGDSLTGVYYHTGGRRAWPELLGLALHQLYPQAPIEALNAGQSGDNTVGALGRLDRDVLVHQPDLVVVMFGMNDVVGVTTDAYAANLRPIVERCRAGGAEVILCTPNAISADGTRPPDKLAQYAALVRQVGGAMSVPVVDCHAAFEAVRERDPEAFMKLMSDAIHPNMSGHKLFAETIAAVISGQAVALGDVPPLLPCFPHTMRRLGTGQPLRVVAMPPYDGLIGPALRSLWPDARLTVERWETAGQSLAQLEAAAQARGWMGLRDHPTLPRPDLVLFAVPATASAVSTEEFWRRYTWVLNWSLSFGQAEWDAAALLPAVAQPSLTTAEQANAALAFEVVRAQDIPYLLRAQGDETPVAKLLQQWLKGQVGQ